MKACTTNLGERASYPRISSADDDESHDFGDGKYPQVTHQVVEHLTEVIANYLR